MAGIGFKFREMVSEGSYLGAIRGYLYSAVFSAGPWILTMVVIAILNTLAPPEVKGNTLIVFRAMLTYIYAMSLVVVGTFQYPITRYIADRIYEKDRGEILSTFIGTLFLFSFMALAVGTVFLWYNTGGFAFKILFMGLFVTITLIWDAMMFLSAIKDYKFIVFVFFSGSLASILLSMVLKTYIGLNGYVLGYYLGQLYILSGLIAEIVREFYNDKGATYYFLKYFKKYATLILAGLAY
ncbi:MAG TPA: exopolysaccharide Pel transporter PelG, partial [Candidatus Wallbacteria bacterium]|nr:exopolysaccharide Pel transporter PelG [Candidatus Wallbacteria bacterium]